MKAFGVHFAYEFRAGLRDRSQLFMNYLFPLLVFLLMASLMSGVNPAFKERMIPAMSIFAMMSGGLLSLSGALITQREAGIFRSYGINGVPARNILLAPATATIAHMAIVSVLIAAMGALVFHAPLPAAFGVYALGWLAAALATVAFGLAIGTVMPDPRAGMLASQLVFLPSMMLGGLMFPAEALPRGLGAVSRLLPAHWAIDAMTSGSIASAGVPLALAILLATAILGFAISLGLFEWHSTPLRKTGPKFAALGILAPALAGLGAWLIL